MGVLKMTCCLFLFFFLVSCGETTLTQEILLRTDTFIKSNSSDNNTELEYLEVGKNSSVESRVIIKLPTTQEDEEDIFDSCFEQPYDICSMFFMPMNILVDLLTSCESQVLQPANLTSAILVFNTVDGSDITAGELELNLLANPWWQSVTWTQAHPFSREGLWSSAGGDIDSTETFEDNCTNLSSGSCSSGEVKFEVTDYFRSLISTSQRHFGFLIKAKGNLSLVRIHSSQAQNSLSPRVVATYTGSCGVGDERTQTKVFYLGRDN